MQSNRDTSLPKSRNQELHPAIADEDRLMSVMGMRSTEQGISALRKTEPKLAQRCEMVLDTARRHKLSLGLCGVRPEHGGVEFVERLASDWVVMPVSIDPGYIQHGMVMPESALQVLLRIRQTGLDFDDIVVAHELPKGAYRPGQPLPVDLLLPPRTTEVRQGSAGLAKVADALGNGMGAAMNVLITKVIPAAAVGSAKIAGDVFDGVSHVTQSSRPALDPILMGLMRPEGAAAGSGRLCAWFYLIHWVW